MPSVINIGLQEYNITKPNSFFISKDDEAICKDTAHPGLRKILTRNKFVVITIDDPVNPIRSNSSKRPCWMEEHVPSAISFMKFEDTEIPGYDSFKFIDAKRISIEIKNAMRDDKDIVVSCMAGLSRSGAVAQAAIDYGFEDTGKVRRPNTLVLTMVKEQLGIANTANTSAFN